MSDPIRTDKDFVDAAKACDDATNVMAMDALYGARDASGRWELHDGWEDGRPGPGSMLLEALPIATSTSGDLLVEVLDAMVAMTPCQGERARCAVWLCVHDLMLEHGCNWFIAACAALLAALGKLERT